MPHKVRTFVFIRWSATTLVVAKGIFRCSIFSASGANFGWVVYANLMDDRLYWFLLSIWKVRTVVNFRSGFLFARLKLSEIRACEVFVKRIYPSGSGPIFVDRFAAFLVDVGFRLTLANRLKTILMGKYSSPIAA